MARLRQEYCCGMRGMLSFLVLFLLSKKELHGQALAQEIGRRKGSRPSPGTIYPALKSLKEAGLIRKRKSGKNRVYSLTGRGEYVLKISKAQFCRTFVGIV